jgi:hypothetical protein
MKRNNAAVVEDMKAHIENKIKILNMELSKIEDNVKNRLQG